MNIFRMIALFIARFAGPVLIGVLISRLGLGLADLEFWVWVVSISVLLAIRESCGEAK